MKMKWTPIRLFFLSLFFGLILGLLMRYAGATTANVLFLGASVIVGLASFVSIVWLGIRIFQGKKLD